MYLEKPSNIGLKVTAGMVVILAVALLTIISGITETNSQQAVQSEPPVTTAPVASSPSEPATTPVSSGAATPAATTSFKDGTYTTTTEYYVPSGYETVKVTVTIQSDVITESSVVGSEKDRESRSFQRDFISGYKSKVVGKSVAGLKLSIVAGSSLTTQGFNDALVEIQKQAKV